MESNGFAQTIHVSDATRDKLKDVAQFCSFGQRFIKGKGNMSTYLVKIGNWEAAIKERKALVESNEASTRTESSIINKNESTQPSVRKSSYLHPEFHRTS